MSILSCQRADPLSAMAIASTATTKYHSSSDRKIIAASGSFFI
jgi:hypothetical protein